ncbi:MAG: 2Fe-2S iron-sulfur cluster-binding protein [Pseudomonadota bacterium]|nr:2Fe-2S iron-sulfur cluster-binding protein [Pseudomonadota bacterium]
MTGFVVKAPNGEFTFDEVPDGVTLMEFMKSSGADVEAACEGNLACATCHVFFTEEVFAQLPDKDEFEDVMLEFLPGVTETSRLSCQLKATDVPDGTVVTVVE